MRHSPIKHIWLIQPAEPPPPALPLDVTSGNTVRFAPSWELLCLYAFIRERTGHTCSLVDIRLYESVAKAFAEMAGNREVHRSDVAVIYAATHTLGSLGEITRFLKEKHPGLPVVLAGPHLVSFPETMALIPGIDYGLRGDPEIILRHLLDAIDIPHRLKLIPGLMVAGAAIKPPYWSLDMRTFNLPEWDMVNWNAYDLGRVGLGIKAEIRLSRGHPGSASDNAWPVPGEPLRVWPLPRIAALFQKLSGRHISEIFLADPPGFWTDERLREWGRHLQAHRNSQPWSFQIIPRDLPDSLLTEIAQHGCRRIELIIPTLETNGRAKCGFHLTNAELADLLRRMRSAQMEPQLVYWIHGPWPMPDEAEKVLSHLRKMDQAAFAVYPFPLFHDAPLYQAMIAEGIQPPPLNEWIAWAQQPEHHKPPAALWPGKSGCPSAAATIHRIHRRVARDPWRIVKRWLPSTKKWDVLTRLEDRSIAWFSRFSKKPPGY